MANTSINNNIPASNVTLSGGGSVESSISNLAAVATSGSYSDLSNTPALGTAAAKDVATSGNASTAQVVMGGDTRLTDARNAADVYEWAKAATKPSYTAEDISYGTSTVKFTLDNYTVPIINKSSGDINDILDQYLNVVVCVYAQSGGFTITNWIGGVDGIIFKVGSSGASFAIAVSGWNAGDVYLKTKWGSSWSAWIKFKMG